MSEKVSKLLQENIIDKLIQEHYLQLLNYRGLTAKVPFGLSKDEFDEYQKGLYAIIGFTKTL